MFLTLLKRAVKSALHAAVDEWAFETGLPQKVIHEMRQKRQLIAAHAEARADTDAAQALGVDDDEEQQSSPVLTMPAAARLTGADSCPAVGADQDALLGWVHRQRQQQTSWAEIARLVNEAGHSISEDALRMRHKRWKEKTGHAEGSADSTA